MKERPTRMRENPKKTQRETKPVESLTNVKITPPT